MLYSPMTKRQELDSLTASMKSERSSFISHWQDIANHVSPRRPRFEVTDVNKGDRRNNKIIDSTGTYAARTLAAGMMAGITSPARPWFRLSTPDPELAEFEPVKEYLHDVTRIMSTVFLRSNLYKVLPSTYFDLGIFGTGCQLLEEDFDTTIINYSQPIGSYCIALNDKLRVAVFFREFAMTVRQLVQKFAIIENGRIVNKENFSEHVLNMWENKRYDIWVNVCHVIQPNTHHNPTKPGFRGNKAFDSFYYEQGTCSGSTTSYRSAADEDKFLRHGGYDLFPALVPRWFVCGEDVYATGCPGMDTLGDVRALQLMQKRKAQAIDKLVNPPIQGGTNLKNERVSVLPGEMNYVMEGTGFQGIRPIYEVDPRVGELMADIQDTRQMILRGYYTDLFLMLAESDRREITATEVAERKEEKLLALGPVLEQLNQDALDPLIDNTFAFLVRQNMLPPAPDELSGVNLKVEYVSVMAQAQKLIGISSQERFIGGINQLATTDATVWAKVDKDEWIDEYADNLGVSPKIIRTTEQANSIRAQSAQAAMQQQQVETMATAAGAAKDLAETPMDTDSALSNLLGT